MIATRNEQRKRHLKPTGGNIGSQKLLSRSKQARSTEKMLQQMSSNSKRPKFAGGDDGRGRQCKARFVATNFWMSRRHGFVIGYPSALL